MSPSKEKPAKPLHQRLHRLLVHAWRSKQTKQESLGRAIGMTQENAGAYLRGKKAGALDLDEARAALHHINIDLIDFLKDVPHRLAAWNAQ